MNTNINQSLGVHPTFTSWRLNGIGVLRIVFGLVWLFDASFKWQPDFINNVMDYISKGGNGQAPVVQSWINFWINVVHVNPQLFAYLVALGETVVALGLIFGVFSNLVDVIGVLLAFAIWSTAEGFGGPYVAGSTDIGAALIYLLVFVLLFLSYAGLHVGLDRYLTPRLGRWGFLASGSLQALKQPGAQDTSSASTTPQHPTH